MKTMSTTQAVQLAVPPSAVVEPIHKSDTVKPGVLFKAVEPSAYRERFTPEAANLNWLSCGEYELAPQTQTNRLCLPNDESLLFMWKGSAEVEVGGER